jgi:hypothetical protein
MIIVQVLYLLFFLIAVVLGSQKKGYKSSSYWFYICFALVGFTVIGLPFAARLTVS